MTHVHVPTTPPDAPRASRSERRAAARSGRARTPVAAVPVRSVPSPRGPAVRTATAFRRRG